MIPGGHRRSTEKLGRQPPELPSTLGGPSCSAGLEPWRQYAQWLSGSVFHPFWGAVSQLPGNLGFGVGVRPGTDPLQ